MANPAIVKRLSEAGYRITGPRQAIVDAVFNRRGHFRAEDILEEARQVAPKTGRATVYRTLLLLTEMDLLEQVHLGEGSHSFVIGDSGHHHHLICSQCGSVTEVHGCDLPEAITAFASQQRFQIDSHQLEVYGRCGRCQAGQR